MEIFFSLKNFLFTISSFLNWFLNGFRFIKNPNRFWHLCCFFFLAFICISHTQNKHEIWIIKQQKKISNFASPFGCIVLKILSCTENFNTFCFISFYLTAWRTRWWIQMDTSHTGLYTLIIFLWLCSNTNSIRNVG